MIGQLLAPVAFVLDDDPSLHRTSIDGVPILDPRGADATAVSAVLVSSDRAERALTDAAEAWTQSAAGGMPVLTIYGGTVFDVSDATQDGDPGVFGGVHTLVPGYMELFREAAAVTGTPVNDWNAARWYDLVHLAEMTAGLPGDSLEAGCHRGMSSFMLCSVFARHDHRFEGGRHVIVDSFEGLSTPTAADGPAAAVRWAEGAFTDTSIEHVRAALSRFGGVRLHKGWIPDVLGELDPDAAYRFVHVDVDLYDPVMACLERFYPRLVPGGMLVVDDFGPSLHGRYPGCAAACRAFSRAHGVTFAPLCGGNALFIKGAA